jgi:hypothetical protein
MGLPEYHYSTAEGDTASTRLTIFFKSLIEALEKHHEARAAYLASESRKLCWDVLFKVLVKVVYQNPGIDLSKVLPVCRGEPTPRPPKSSSCPSPTGLA